MPSSSIESSFAPERRRLSKLAAAAFIAAGLTAPFVTLPLDFRSVWPLFVLPVLPLVGGIISLLRIGRSEGRLRGQTFAMTAVVLSLVWIGSTVVLVSLGVHEGWNASTSITSDN